MFGIVAPQHTMQKASYFVMLAGLYRKPSPLTCAPRAVPGDDGGEPTIDAVRGRRAWCPPWSCCTPGPSFGPWARRPGCPAGKFHPRPWPCLILLLGSRRIAVRARVLQSGGIHWDVIVGNPDPPDSECESPDGSSFKMRMSRLGWIYYARRPVFLMLASVLQPLAVKLAKTRAWELQNCSHVRCDGRSHYINHVCDQSAAALALLTSS